MPEQKPQKWVLVVSFLFSLLTLFVSASLIFSPESVLKTVDLGAKGVRYLILMWAARQFALSFIFAFSAVKKSTSMLMLAYVFFLVMNVGDFFIGILQKGNSLYVGAAVMCLLSSVMLYFLNKNLKLVK